MFEGAFLTPWVYLILIVAYLPFLFLFLFKKAFWPCFGLSLAGIIGFSLCCMIFGVGFLPIVFALCVEGVLLFFGGKRKGDVE